MKAIRVGAAIALAAVACDPVKNPPPTGDNRQPVVELPATPNRDLDLLFVIDDSPSMLDKQTNLKTNFPSFVDRLQGVPGGLPNLHIGVVTTDMGTKASESATPGASIGQVGQGGCSGTGKGGQLQIFSAPVTGKFLVDVEGTNGTRTTNYTGTLADAFRAMASAGAGGCGFEQPLAAMRAALDGNPANAGFLRATAMLGVIFVTDEDDCSAKSTTLFGPESATLGPLQSFRCTRFGVTCAVGGQTTDAMNTVGAKDGCASNPGSALIDDVAPYRDFLRALKGGDDRKLAVTAVAGATAPFAVEVRTPPGGGTALPALAHSCTYTGQAGAEVADPGTRIQDFLRGFGDRSAFTSICQSDLSGNLVQLGELFRKSLGGPCVEEPIADVDAKKAGLQTDCIVEDLLRGSAFEIKSCEASPDARPCWRFETDPAACPSFANLKLVVVRAVPPDPETVTRMRCTLEQP